MSKNNAAIYGPPNHKPTRFTIQLEDAPGGGYVFSIQATATTKVGPLWFVREAAKVEEQPYAHLIVATELERVMGDMLVSRPDSEERARFVISGGLWHQPELPLM